MAGYTRQDTANNIANGNVIDADDFDAEYNQIENAFNASTGHVHDGSIGEGAPIEKVGPSQDLQITSGALQPKTDNTLDLGTSSLEFKDGFFDGTLNADALVADTADINGGSVDGATLGTNSAITQAVIDNININGATIGHTDDTDLLTLADGIVTVAGEISVTTLDIGGTNVTSSAAQLNILDGVTSTSTELNIVDGNTSATSTTLADADRVVVNDGGTMVQVALSDFETYFEAGLDTLSSVTTVGALNAGSITSGFGNINNGSSTITTTGAADLGETTVDSLSVSDGNITNVGDIALDSISADGSSIAIGTSQSGAAVNIGHSTSETTVGDNLTVTGNAAVSGNATITGDLTVSGTTTTVNSTTVNLNDHNIVLDSGNSTSAVINGAGITLEGGSGDNATFTYNTTGPKFEMKLGSSHESLQVDQLIAASLDISGDVDIDGTLEADAITVNGTALSSVISGTLVTNASNAVTVTGAAQSNITSLGTLTTLTVDDITIDGSKISDSGNLEIETGSTLTLDATSGVISIQTGTVSFVDDGTSRAQFDFNTASTMKMSVFDGSGFTEQLRLTDNGASVVKGLVVGNTSTTPTDNDIIAVGTINAASGFEVNGTSVISSSRVLQNVTGLKTINSTSILGSGNIAITNTGVGIGQTWAQYSSSDRATGTSYQNTTGSPIQVSIFAGMGTGGRADFQVSTDNSTFVSVSGINDVNVATMFGAIVPNNHYYKVTVVSGSYSQTFWAELR